MIGTETALPLDPLTDGSAPIGADTEARTARVARNVFVLLGSQIAMWLSGSGLGILLPRYLGDADSGRIAFATAFISLFALLVLFGSERLITREIARDPSQARHMTFNALVSRVPFLVAATVFIFVFVHLMDYEPAKRQVVYIFTATMWMSTVATTLMAVLQGMERMTLTSFANVTERVIGGVLGVGAVIFASQGMITYALILLAASAVGLSIIAVYYMNIVGLSWRFDYRVTRRLLVGGGPFVIWGIALVVYGTIDITMLSFMSGDEVVGWYSSAYRFIGIAGFIPFSITTALLPSISSAPIAESRALIKRCSDIVLFTSVPIAAFFLVASQNIVDFLGYPSEFDNSVILMQILSVHIPLTAFAMVAGTVLIAANREVPRTKLAVMAAVINPLVNLAAIPYFQHYYGNGGIGAALISVAIEVFMTVGMLRLLQPGIFDRSDATTAMKCVAAAVPMSAAMILVMPLGLIPIMVAGAIVYPIAAVLFGALTIDEVLAMPKLVLARGRAPATSAG